MKHPYEGKEAIVDFDDLKTAIMMMASEMENKPEDAHEMHLKLREMLDQIRATGMPLPEDLVELERKLERDVEGVPPDQ